jgi:hypothetical protein
MDFLTTARGLAAAGLILGALGIALQLNEIMRRPFKQDLSRAQGSDRRGILYAFTLGMAPWEKESTRLHWFLYLRGILFHVGVFAAFAVLIASPWLGRLPEAARWAAAAITGGGAVAGFAGIFIRLAGANERALSLPDDYFSVFLASLFTAFGGLGLAFSGFLPFFYLAAGLLGLYLPFSKIRHCVYFFYSKFFFGKSFGHRGVIGQPGSPYAE